MRRALIVGVLIYSAGILGLGPPTESAIETPAREVLTVSDDYPSAREKADSAPVSTTRRRVVDSTAYCEHGTMADGRQTHVGAVAMNGVKFGTRFRVISGPLASRVFTVADRIGHSSGFDVWMASCAEARVYGRRHIAIEEAV